MDPPSHASLPHALDADSVHWVRALSSSGGQQDAAVARLHGLLVRVARSEVNRRANSRGITGPELEDLAHQAAADALMAIVEKVGQFRGESRFTTWACRFVILEVSMKLGRHFWRSAPTPIDSEDWDVLPDRFGLSPARRAEWRELVAAVRCAVDEELTPHQRRIFVAIVLRGIPLDALVVELGSNRNAIYKAMFDARRKLRLALAANGYVDHDTVGLS
jgi:RNA polymerase sigma-70 factor (ECF subfamily)